MAAAHGTSWRALAARGFADLSPPEVVHAVLELPTDRAEYIGLVEAIGDYPARSPIGQRRPSEAEVAALRNLKGKWRAVVLLDDERALKTAACLFDRAFVLDPFYDSGALLYAAWHDPLIKHEHARRVADEAGSLVRAAPLLQAGTAVLAPDHLPGSWNPQPGWRKPRPSDGDRQVAGWWMRTALVLLYWADRLDAVVCATRAEVVAALEVVLGPRGTVCALESPEPPDVGAAQALRGACAPLLTTCWRAARRTCRRRTPEHVDAVAYLLSDLSSLLGMTHPTAPWRLRLGEASVPEPAMLIRRVLNGQHPDRPPRLPRKELRRPPLCLLAASARPLRGAMRVLDDAHLVDRDRPGRDHVADAG